MYICEVHKNLYVCNCFWSVSESVQWNQLTKTKKFNLHWHSEKKKIHNHINRTLGTSARWIMFFLPGMEQSVERDRKLKKYMWRHGPFKYSSSNYY